MILNLGAGRETYGDVRVDMHRSFRPTVLANLDSDLPFKDETFDEVYSRCLFEHLKNPFGALLEMKRVCRRQGKITIITDNAAYPMNYVQQTQGVHVGGYAKMATGPKDRHYAVYTREHILNFAEAAELQVLSLELTYWSQGVSLISRVLRFVPWCKEMAFPWVKLVAQKP